MINDQQFGQPELPGMPTPKAPGLAERLRDQGLLSDPPTHRQTYTNTSGNRARNPLYEEDEGPGDIFEGRWLEEGVRSTRSREWIPTGSLVSEQGGVNPDAVEHLASSYDPHPSISVRASGDNRWVVGDGNHRANAALKRGQMFLAASTERSGGRDAPSLGPVKKSRVDVY